MIPLGVKNELQQEKFKAEDLKTLEIFASVIKKRLQKV